MKKIAAALVAAVLLMSNISDACAAFVIGWNFIRPLNCLEVPTASVDYLYVYPTTGGVLFTIDLTTITLIAPLCASGDGFYIYWTGTGWTDVSVYASIK